MWGKVGLEGRRVLGGKGVLREDGWEKLGFVGRGELKHEKFALFPPDCRHYRIYEKAYSEPVTLIIFLNNPNEIQ